jgi:hypothetical protein
MNELVASVLPEVLNNIFTALIAAGAAWGAMKMELRYIARDIEYLRERLHGSQNPRSVVNTLQDHETRLTILETLEEHKK